MSEAIPIHKRGHLHHNLRRDVWFEVLKKNRRQHHIELSFAQFRKFA